MSSAMTQHYHSPPRDHQNQHTEKCSVHTRRCSALQCTLISCSSSSCSTGLSVTSPHLHSESIFIPLHASGTTCVVSSILVCFFLGLLQLFTILLLPTPSLKSSAFRAQPWWFLEVTHISTLNPSLWFSPPCLIASLASCPEYLMATHLILHSHTVSLLHFQHCFCYSVTHPFSIGALLGLSSYFQF